MALILVRYGEVAIKGAVTRSRMEGLLVHNILSGLRGVGVEGRVVRSQGRLFVEVPDDRVRDAVDVVSRVFGVKSLSPVREYQFRELGDIVNAAVKEWGDVIRGRRFAVRVHRVGSHGFTSMDVAKAVGAALKPSAPVLTLRDLTLSCSSRLGVTGLTYSRRLLRALAVYHLVLRAGYWL